MYVPPRYALTTDDAWSLVREVGAGSLVVVTNLGLRSVFAPVMGDQEEQRLRFHVSRANPLWRDSRDGDEAVALFTLADAYVSPGFYPTKHEDPGVAPTWDYVVCEVKGNVTIHDDSVWVESLVRELTERFEAPQEEPWSVDDAPAPYVERLVSAIVGVSIEVSEITAAAKLSQNKNVVDRRSVRARLAARGGDGATLAERMGEMS